MFNRDELGSLYNCVVIVISQRERDNELTNMFSDEPVEDSILDRLYALEQKLIKDIEALDYAKDHTYQDNFNSLVMDGLFPENMEQLRTLLSLGAFIKPLEKK